MIELTTIIASCGVVVRYGQGRFEHLATAWTVAPGEWVTAWLQPEPPGDDVMLMTVSDGAVGAIAQWECADGLAGFTSVERATTLTVEREAELGQRIRLTAVGYPCLIDHPAFLLHRGSLDPSRYFPYLCPWTIGGHTGLFSATDGYMTGRLYAGMSGGPVLDDESRVVGVLLDGGYAPDHPPLTRFRRLV